jgi:hypothetical protein
MLLAGMAALGAGVFAYLAVSQPWVHLTITRFATASEEAFVATMALRGKAAFVGTAGSTLAIVLAVYGLVWFVFGFQRGWTMPGVTNPAFGFIVTVTGLIATVLASTVWFVWEEAMVSRAKLAGMTSAEMKELLDLQPTPLVQIERLSGLMTFGGMMVLGFVACGLGWYAYRRRG